MNATQHNRRWRPVALALVTLAVAACDPDTQPLITNAPVANGDLTLGLEVSSLTTTPGGQVAVAVTADGAPLIAIQGFLRFDPARLKYRGQVTQGQELTLVNPAGIQRGVLRFGSMEVEQGLGVRVATLVFDVTGAGYDRGLRFDLESAALRGDGEITRARSAVNAVVAADLAVRTPESVTPESWLARFHPAAVAADEAMARGMAQSPGQYQLNLQYGDVNLNGAVNITDAAQTLNAAVGTPSFNLIVGTGANNRDFVIAGNVRPAGTVPGFQADGSRILNSTDAANIGLEAVCLPGAPGDACRAAIAVVGDLIPGRGALPDPVADRQVVFGTAAGGTLGACSILIDNDTTWTKNKIAELPGIVCVTNNSTLTIQPGTRVEGTNTAISALFVMRDGRIIADGTVLEPIVMTCTLAEGSKTKGCWGGLWIAGNDSLNNGTASSPNINVDRTPTFGCFEKQGEGNAPFYGGCNPNDSSGVIRFVRIEHAGFVLSTNNELNGLTLGGVGRKTVIDYVQVHAGLDDGIEFFGGSVNVKHAYLTAISDDDFDGTFSWNGKAQFILSQKDPNDGDKGFEMDNAESPTPFSALPRTSPTIFNVTLVGKPTPAVSTTGGTNQVNDAMHLRRGFGAYIKNVIAIGWVRVLDLDDIETCVGLNTDNINIREKLILKNSIFARIPAENATTPAGYVTTGQGLGNYDSDPVCGGYASPDVEKQWIQDAANSNQWFYEGVPESDTLLVDAFSTSLPDYRPRNSFQSLVTSVGVAPPNDGFFDATADYAGAVPPATVGGGYGGGIGWWSGWTRGWQSASMP